MKKAIILVVILFIAGTVFGQDARLNGAWVIDSSNIYEELKGLNALEISLFIFRDNEAVHFLGGHISTRWKFTSQNNIITLNLIKKYDPNKEIEDTLTWEYWFTGNNLFFRDPTLGFIEKYEKL